MFLFLSLLCELINFGNFSAIKQHLSPPVKYNVFQQKSIFHLISMGKLLHIIFCEEGVAEFAKVFVALHNPILLLTSSRMTW